MDLRSKKTRLVLVVSLVSYLLIVVVLDIGILGNNILRAVAGLALLGILPGYLLVSLLGLGNRPPGRIIFYSVGLSVPVVVCLSIILNTVLPVFAVNRPLSPWSLTVAASALVLGLSAVWYTNNGSPTQLTLRQWLPSPTRSTLQSLSLSISNLQSLSLSISDYIAFVMVSLLPIYSALVTVSTDTAGFDWLLIPLLCALSVVPLVLIWWQGSPRLYPYAIWAVAAAVLLQMTLVSSHLWGWDIHYEYFTAAKIFENGYWEAGLSNSSNSLVSVTLLAAVYSMVTGMDLVLVYKLIYPLLVSLLPVGIWYVVRSEFADRTVATLAPFVLVFYYGFFEAMPDKQLVAGLFAIFLLVAFLDRELSTIQRWVLGLSFAMALVFSHYGVSLLFVGFLTFALVARYATQKIIGIEVDTRITRPTLVTFLGIFWVVWYLFTASGVNFYRVIDTGYQVLEALPFPETERNGIAYATMGFESGYWLVYKFMHILLLGLIAIGIVSALYALSTDRENTRSSEYTLISVGVFCFLVSSVVVTFSMGFDRILQIALFILSPFAIVGAKTAVSFVLPLAAWLPQDDLRARVNAIPSEGLFAVFLALLFLFSSGTVFALAGQPVPRYNINLDEDAGWPVYSQSEVEAMQWLESHLDENATIAVYNTRRSINSRDGLLLRETFDTERLEPIWLSRARLDDSAYVYVSHKPVKYPTNDTYIDVSDTPFYEETLSRTRIVYSDDNVTIYYVPEYLTSV